MRQQSRPVDLEPVDPVVVQWPAAAPRPEQWPARSVILPDPAPPVHRLAAVLSALRESRTILRHLHTGRGLADPLAVRAEVTADRLDSCLEEVWGIGERTTR